MQLTGPGGSRNGTIIVDVEAPSTDLPAVVADAGPDQFIWTGEPECNLADQRKGKKKKQKSAHGVSLQHDLFDCEQKGLAVGAQLYCCFSC